MGNTASNTKTLTPTKCEPADCKLNLHEETIEGKNELDSTKKIKIECNNEEILHKLLNAKANTDVEIEGHMYNPLNYAVELGNDEIIKSLLSSGANINKKSMHEGTENTPLHIATRNQDEEMVHVLLEAGADPNIEYDCEHYGYLTPLHIASRCGNEKIVSMLITAGADIEAKDLEFGYTPWQYAIIYRKPKVLRILVKAGADLNSISNMGETVFDCVHISDLESAKILIKAGYDINTKNSRGITAIHRALEENNTPLIKLLLANGASLNLENRDGCKVLDSTLKSMNLNTMKTLIECGVKVKELLRTTHCRYSKLRYAAETNDVPMIEYLQSKGASIKSKEGSSTLLHHAAANNNCTSNLEVIKMLLKNGLNINARNEYGNTPVHYLINRAHVDVLKFFLENKADINIKCNKGRNLIFHAVWSNNTQAVQFLLDNYSNINELKDDRSKLTLLHEVCASEYKRIAMIKLLLKNGSNINALDSQGRTPLMWAIKFSFGTGLHPYEENQRLADLMRNTSSREFRKLIEVGRFLLEHSDVNIVTPKGLNILNICINGPLSRASIEHLAKLKMLGKSVHPKILETISTVNEYKDYFQKCIEELTVAKNTKFDKSWVSYFNLLVDSQRKLKNYAGNENIVKEFLENGKAWSKKFKIFGASMKKKMKKGLKRRQVYDESSVLLSDCLPILNPTHLIIRDVLDYVSTKDLLEFREYHDTNEVWRFSGCETCHSSLCE